MASIYKTSKFKGVRYREHETRKNGIRKDRYFTIRYKVNGKSKEEGIGWESEGASELKAFQELCKIKENIKLGEGYISLSEKRKNEEEHREKVKAENILFSELWDIYNNEVLKFRPAKAKTSEQGIYENHIKPILGNKLINDITSRDLLAIKDYMIKKNQKYAPETLDRSIVVVRQIYNKAISFGLFKGENPARKLKKIKHDNQRLRFLTTDEASLLLEELKKIHSTSIKHFGFDYQKEFKTSQVYEIALTSLYSGLRANEVFSLKAIDINTDTGLLTVRRTKNSEVRHIPMPKILLDTMKQRLSYFNFEPNDYVFQTINRKKIVDISDQYQAIADKLFNEGIEDRQLRVVFHTLRHTYASWLVMKGVDLYTVQKLMGHKDLKMTQRYAHLSPNKFTEAIKVLDD